MKKRTFLLILIIVTVLYLFVFPLRLQKEISFIPQWNLDIATSTVAQDGSPGIPFIAPDGAGRQMLGYFSEEGALLFRTPVFYGAAVHSEGFINYSRLGGDLIFQSPQGELQRRLESDGYPLFQGGMLFTVSRDRKGFARWSLEGELLWRTHFGSLITSLDVQNSGILLGFLNGDVIYIDHQGAQQVFTRQKISAIYGCALSVTQELFATVSGLDPQVLSLYSFREGDVQLLWERDLEESLPSYRFLRFGMDARTLFWNSPRGVESLDWMGGEARTFSLDTPFREGYLGKSGELSAFFGADGRMGELVFAEVGRPQSLRILFDGHSNALRLRGENLLFAREGEIFQIVRKGM